LNLLGPCGGREVGWTEPPQCVPGELLARNAGAARVVHVATEALGEGRRVFEAAANLGCCNLDAALGIASRISLGERASGDERRKGQRENERCWCDVACAHSRPQITSRQFATAFAKSFIFLGYVWYNGGVSACQTPIWLARTAGNSANAEIDFAQRPAVDLAIDRTSEFHVLPRETSERWVLLWISQKTPTGFTPQSCSATAAVV
jgi:hypothetical protein